MGRSRSNNMSVYTVQLMINIRNGKRISPMKHIISTTDMDGLMHLIRDKSIDGVFCGPSEFNILNTIKLV